MQHNLGRQVHLKTSAIDRTSHKPYYVQIKEFVRERIDRREWPSGTQLPSEIELCELFSVSRTVIRQALQELTYEGALYRAKGKGTFIAEPKINEGLAQHLTGFYEDMAQRGIQPVSQILRRGVIPASPRIARLLKVPENHPLIEISRLRFVKQEPIVLTTSCLPYTQCQPLLEADLSNQSLYRVLEEQCGVIIVQADRTIEAVLADEYEATLLRVKKGAPLIALDSVGYQKDGTPVEFFHALHRGDRSRFEVRLGGVRSEDEHAPVLTMRRSIIGMDGAGEQLPEE